jgi:hypothetical protein
MVDCRRAMRMVSRGVVEKSMSRAGKRMSVVGVAALAGTSLVLTCAGNANAFVTKRTQLGAPVHWQTAHVSFVLDDGLVAAVSGASPAIAAAAQGWSGVSGAPLLSVAPGPGGTQPKVDGTNTILFAPQGYAPAGNALAITVLSYDESTGAIVDADIVVNGMHAFAVLASGATAPRGAAPVATEGSSGTASPHDVFDLQHVVAHEVGHALGLGDEPTEPSDLMYPYTLPEDASVRWPASDDLAGIDSIYAGSPGGSSGGCGGASVAGTRPNARDAWEAWALLAIAGAWRFSRRGARAILPCAAACVVFIGDPHPARSTPDPVARANPAGLTARAAVDATARVTHVDTTNVHGVFETVVELAPERCARSDRCPARIRAHAWGGTLGGITQVVGETPAPRVDDEVDLSLARTRQDEEAEDVQATMLVIRRALSAARPLP